MYLTFFADGKTPSIAGQRFLYQLLVLFLFAAFATLVVARSDGSHKVKSIFLLLYGVFVPFIPCVYVLFKSKLPIGLNAPIIIFFTVMLCSLSNAGVLHRTYTGFVILSFMVFTRSPMVLMFLLVGLFLNNNKISLLAGLIFVSVYFNSVSKASFVVKSMLATILISIIVYVAYLKVGHWLSHLEAGHYEKIHAINHRLGNYQRVMEVWQKNYSVILGPFDFKIINKEAMDSGYLVALFRWGAAFMAAIFVCLWSNIVRTFEFKVVYIFFIPLLTQAAYLNVLVLIPMLGFFLFLNSPYERKKYDR